MKDIMHNGEFTVYQVADQGHRAWHPHRVFAAFTSVALVFSLLAPAGFAVADSPHTADISIDSITDSNGTHNAPFDFSCPANPLFNPVTIDGSGSVTSPVGLITQYAVNVDWGDGSPTEDIPVTLNQVGATDTYTFTYSAGPHTYSIDTSFSIIVNIHHATNSGHDSTDATANAIITCIVPAVPATLNVIKHVVGGEASASNWNLHVKISGQDVHDSPQAGAESPGTAYTLAAGTYSVTETDGPTGYTASYSGDCNSDGNVTLASDDSKTCTITNTFDSGGGGGSAHIIVDKVTDPSKDPQSFDFVTTGAGYNGFSLTDQDAPNDQTVVPGTYTVAETPVAGWTLENGHPSCVYDNQSVDIAVVDGEQLVVEDGDTVTCTFTNTFSDNGGGRFTLDITTTGNGEGVVTSEDGGINCDSNAQETDCSETYPNGTEVNLTATPDAGSNFNHSWTVGAGTCTGHTTPCTVTVTGNTSLTAHFALNTSGGGSRGGGGSSGGSTPQGQVLGDQTASLPFQDPGQGQVLGASTTLPRTGMPVGALALLLIPLAAPFLFKPKAKAKKV